MVNPVGTGRMAAQDGIQSAVLTKLIVFALLMAFVPIATYFGSLKYMWQGSTTAAAISAVFAANAVLVGYVVVAFREDIPQTPSSAPVSEKRKDR